MRYSLACLSDTGTVRKLNEDNFTFFGNVMPIERQSLDAFAMDLPDVNSSAVAVFDRMVRGVAGEAASFAAATSLGEYTRDVSAWDQSRILITNNHMNNSVPEVAIAERVPSTGTTAVIFTLSHSNAWVSNFGDSPALLYDGSGMTVLAVAYTDEGLTDDLGIFGCRLNLAQHLGIDCREMTIEPYSILMKEESARRKALEVKDLVREHGGKDDTTVIVCNVLSAEGACHD